MTTETTLAEACIPNGLQTGPFGSQLKAEEYTETGIPVVMPRDIIDGRIKTGSIARIPEKIAKKLKKHVLLKGDIIFSRRGDLSKVAVISSDEEGFVCGTGCLRARPRSEHNPDYLRYLALTEQVAGWLVKHSVGQTMPNLNTDILSYLPLFIPNRHTQDEIVLVLSSWDRSIDLTGSLIAAKQERRSWLMQQLLTGKKRLPGFEKSKDLRKTPFGTLPADWKYPKIGEFSVEVSERNGSEGSRPVLSCTKHRGLVDSLAYFGKRIFSEDLSYYKIVRSGQFAYATNHIDEGSIGYQDQYNEVLISPIYTVFQTDTTINDKFRLLNESRG